jgi:PAS domain S-box-containing protein
MAANRAGQQRMLVPRKDRRRVLDPIYRQILDGIQLGVVVFRLEDPCDPGSLRIISVNPAAARMAGAPQSLATAVGKTLREAFPEALDTDRPRRCVEVVASGIPQDLGDVRETNHASHVYTAKAFPLPGDCLGVVFDDVTKQRESNEGVRRSEAQLARTQQLGRMGSWVWDVSSDRLTWSDELGRIYGVSPETFAGTFAAFLDLVHPDDRAMVETVVRGALERREPFHFKGRIVRPDGEMRLLDSHGDVMVDDGGVPIEMFGICRDITQDEHALQALLESERRFAKTVQGSPVAICIISVADGRLVEANPRFVELLGYGSRDQLVGRLASDVGLWQSASHREDVLAQLYGGRSVSEIAVTYVTRTGESRRAIAAVEFIEIGGEECVLKMVWWSEKTVIQAEAS